MRKLKSAPMRWVRSTTGKEGGFDRLFSEAKSRSTPFLSLLALTLSRELEEVGVDIDAAGFYWVLSCLRTRSAVAARRPIEKIRRKKRQIENAERHSPPSARPRNVPYNPLTELVKDSAARQLPLQHATIFEVCRLYALQSILMANDPGSIRNDLANGLVRDSAAHKTETDYDNRMRPGSLFPVTFCDFVGIFTRQYGTIGSFLYRP
ncbi:hypothetical protein GWI33_001756 [Rhynchophorus ferrugineus]|uniref:Uncharacterized protein n=1 Tax=Rhynchophorus ferrugineus TaxID=354439 RepID=A0A834MHY7_RHYFE|nr:hypothetical protein GWI33_001756 [Rhynchophorus ferrugineus]